VGVRECVRVYRLCVVGGAFIPFARVGARRGGWVLGVAVAVLVGGRGKGGGGSVIYY